MIAGATHPEIVRHEGESYRQGLHRQVAAAGAGATTSTSSTRSCTPAELSALLQPDHDLRDARTGRRSRSAPARSRSRSRPGARWCPPSYRYAEDLLGDGAGVLVPCHDVAGARRRHRGLLDDPAALAAAQAGRRRARRAAHLARRRAAGRRPDPGRGERGRAPAVAAGSPCRRCRCRGCACTTWPASPTSSASSSSAAAASPTSTTATTSTTSSRLAIVSAGLLSLAPPPPPQVTNLAQRWVRMSVRFLIAAARDRRSACTTACPTAAAGSTSRTPATTSAGRCGRWACSPARPAVPAEVRRHGGRRCSTTLAPHAPALAEVRPAQRGLRDPRARRLRSPAGEPRRAGRPGRAAWTPRSRPPPTRPGTGSSRNSPTTTPGWRTRCSPAPCALDDRAVAARALTALDWYADHAGLTAGMLRNVGNRWHHRDAPGGWADDGDEQPIDAASAVEAMVEAWRYTGDARYGSLAGVAYGWFHGRNRARRRHVRPAHRRLPRRPDARPAPTRTRAPSRRWRTCRRTLALLLAGLAALPDRVPVEPPRHRAAMREAAAKAGGQTRTKGYGTGTGPHRTRRAGPAPAPRKGQHDAR